MRDLVEDLEAEQIELDGLVTAIDEPSWDTATPAAPWTIRDTISHLAFFDERESQAIRDPDGFAVEINQRVADGIDRYIDLAIAHGRSMPAGRVLEWWREARGDELAAFATVDPDQRLPWYGPPMKARSAVIARMMETWAHGQDVADALGSRRPPTRRLFHIAELGVKTFSWSFTNRGLEVPATRVRVVLEGPDGSTRVWNEAMPETITGPVEDFCLVVAQRRHHLDTALKIEGETACRWMEVAQIFAGPPGPGRPPVG
ncbi:MAG: TIGR03084 family metal-binding protein [Acidimicrobiia bacterium]